MVRSILSDATGDFPRQTLNVERLKCPEMVKVKRGINGTYVWVSKKHLQLYLREFEYRHNLRKQPALMFELLLQAFPKVRVE